MLLLLQGNKFELRGVALDCFASLAMTMRV